MQSIPYSELKDLVLIGGGGFGFVYKAWHAQHGTVVYKELDNIKLRDKYAQFVLFQLDSINFNIGYILGLVRCVHIVECCSLCLSLC